MSEDITVREAAALLQGWDRILILTHQYPDGDTLGSGFALCRQIGVEQRKGGVAEIFTHRFHIAVHAVVRQRLHQRDLRVQVVLPESPVDHRALPYRDLAFLQHAALGLEFRGRGPAHADHLAGPAAQNLVIHLVPAHGHGAIRRTGG